MSAANQCKASAPSANASAAASRTLLTGGALGVIAALLVSALLAANFTGLFNAFGLGTAAQRMLLAAAPDVGGEPVLLVGIDHVSEQVLRRFNVGAR